MTRDNVGVNARPFIHGPESGAVARVLAGGQYGHSAETERFEEELAAYLGVPPVVAVTSGTDALHLALLAVGVGPGDEVVVPSMTFCASVQAILMCGAVPRFADVDPVSLCVTADTVAEAITPNTRAIMPVLYGGRAVDLTGIEKTLTGRAVPVVEDAAQAFGSRCGTHLVGARPHVATCFSFGPIKQLTCGQGGAIIPRTEHEAALARSLRLLGIGAPQADRLRTTTYAIEHPGWRAPMSGINAAIGRIQLARLPALQAVRVDLWRAYATRLADLPDVAIVDVDIDRSVPFNCVIRIPHRDAVHRAMQNRGIGVGVHYPPNHLQPAFASWHRPLPATELAAEQILSLPFHPAMDDDDVRIVVSVLAYALHEMEARW